MGAAPRVLVNWATFDCDGEHLEWCATTTRAGASAASMRDVLLICVRRPGDANGPGMIYPSDRVPSEDLAVEAARAPREQLGSALE